MENSKNKEAYDQAFSETLKPLSLNEIVNRIFLTLEKLESQLTPEEQAQVKKRMKELSEKAPDKCEQTHIECDYCVDKNGNAVWHTWDEMIEDDNCKEEYCQAKWDAIHDDRDFFRQEEI